MYETTYKHIIHYTLYLSKMNRFSSITLALCILLSCSSVVSATNTATIQNNNERQLQAGNNNDPLLDNWEKEEGLANMINEMIESSKTKSPSYSPTEAPTDKPSKVSYVK